LKLIPNRSKNRDTALLLVPMPRAASSLHSSESVMSGFSTIRALSQWTSASKGEVRPPPRGFGASCPSARNACIHFTAVEALTWKTFDCDRAERPCSTERINRTRKSFEYAISPLVLARNERIGCFAKNVNPLSIHNKRETL
jgi:hypothetical protein